jgi:hypothetical protein
MSSDPRISDWEDGDSSPSNFNDYTEAALDYSSPTVDSGEAPNGGLDVTAGGLSDTPNDTEAINWDAKERLDGFPPRLIAGQDYLFTFSLEDKDPFVERDAGPAEARVPHTLEVTYKASTPNPNPAVNGEERKPVVLRFQRAGHYVSPKAKAAGNISDVSWLLIGLGLRPPNTNAAIAAALKEAAGRGTTFTAQVGWELVCKDCKAADGKTKLRVSTNPRGRKGATRWPRSSSTDPKEARGGLVLMATCPGCGATDYGREFVSQIRRPKA